LHRDRDDLFFAMHPESVKQEKRPERREPFDNLLYEGFQNRRPHARLGVAQDVPAACGQEYFVNIE
jgi:hypothetical protein